MKIITIIVFACLFGSFLLAEKPSIYDHESVEKAFLVDSSKLSDLDRIEVISRIEELLQSPIEYDRYLAHRISRNYADATESQVEHLERETSSYVSIEGIRSISSKGTDSEKSKVLSNFLISRIHYDHSIYAVQECRRALSRFLKPAHFQDPDQIKIKLLGQILREENPFRAIEAMRVLVTYSWDLDRDCIGGEAANWNTVASLKSHYKKHGSKYFNPDRFIGVWEKWWKKNKKDLVVELVLVE